jgi:uroporphyrinogen-III synthase
LLADELRALGADVVAVPVYRWTLPGDDLGARRLVEAACEGQLDAVTFTSAPALGNCIDIATAMGARDSLLHAFTHTVRLVSIGSVCTEAARSYGIEPTVIPDRHRLGSMVMALTRHAKEVDDAARLQVGRREIGLRAAAVVVDDRVVELTPRERALLSALLEQPGTVVSKATLLRRAWPGEEVDEHAVETAVARLRRRLDGLLSIAVVARRGYQLTE